MVAAAFNIRSFIGGNYLVALFFMIETATVNPKVILELFSIYHDWQEKKAQEISIRQVCSTQE